MFKLVIWPFISSTLSNIWFRLLNSALTSSIFDANASLNSNFNDFNKSSECANFSNTSSKCNFDARVNLSVLVNNAQETDANSSFTIFNWRVVSSSIFSSNCFIEDWRVFINSDIPSAFSITDFWISSSTSDNLDFIDALNDEIWATLSDSEFLIFALTSTNSAWISFNLPVSFSTSASEETIVLTSFISPIIFDNIELISLNRFSIFSEVAFIKSSSLVDLDSITSLI